MSFGGKSKRHLDYESALADYTSACDSPYHAGPRQKKRSTPFSEEKLSWFQQHVEVLNQQYKDLLLQSGPDEDKCLMLTAEYLRILNEIKALYQRPTGELMAMGSDDCCALGISISNDDEKDGEYPPTFSRNIPSNIVQVEAGGLHSVALTEDGRVFTFGQNDDNALGRDMQDEVIHLAGEVTSFPLESLRRMVMIAAGDNHSLFLDIEGKVFMCGMYKDIDSGKFANVKPGEKLKNGTSQRIPIQIQFDQPVRKIVAGHSTNAAILADDSLYTWGMGHFGELGRSRSMGAPIIQNPDGHQTYDLGKKFIGEEYTEMKPNKEGKMEPVTNYRYHTDLILKEFLTPQPVEWNIPGKYIVLDVAVGELHMIVVARKDGLTGVYSTGHNQYGQLGLGDQLQRHELTSVEALDGEVIVQVAAGSSHSLFRNTLGTAVFACGRIDYGQLGLLDTKEKEAGGFRSTPEQIAFPDDAADVRIADIAAGANHSMAVLDNGDIYTWGFNVYGQTGHPVKDINGSEDIERPKKLNPLRYYKKHGLNEGTCGTVSDMSCGGQHSLMVVQRYTD